jgi:uncharacterized membrane protein
MQQLEHSILAQKALAKDIQNIYVESINKQVDLFKETLIDLEEYLDTGDLSLLTESSLEVIKIDILELIKGFRNIQNQKYNGIFNLVKTIDGILEKLRLARNNIFVLVKMIDGDKLKSDERELFFAKLSETRQNVADALKLIL